MSTIGKKRYEHMNTEERRVHAMKLVEARKK